MKRFKSIFVVVLLVTGVISAMVGYAQGDLTADEILDRLNDDGDIVGNGDIVFLLRFDNTFSDGSTASNLFGGLKVPDKSLIYFKEPVEVEGCLFLSVNVEEENSLWYQDMGDSNRREDYVAELIGEETLTIGAITREVYVIKETANPGVDLDSQIVTVWIDKETFLPLRREGIDADGNYERTMEVVKLGEFEGRIVVSELLATAVKDEKKTVVTFLDRHRPVGGISDTVFEAANLPKFLISRKKENPSSPGRLLYPGELHNKPANWRKAKMTFPAGTPKRSN
jgi:outer membrane lipoprotein-sorting protein